MNIITFLDYLEKVRANGSQKWMACCPAHDDRSPSLSIRETDDGSILINCFSGCTADEITDSLGLKLTDLFADKNYTFTANKIPRKKLEKALMHELTVLNIAINSRHERHEIHPDDKDREKLSVKRIEALSKEIYQ